MWRETFVEEGNIAKHIFLFRKIIESEQNGKSCIETVPKRGYRFIAEVTAIGDEEEQQPAPDLVPPKPDGAPHRSLRRALIAACILLVCGLAAAIYFGAAHRASPTKSVIVLPFTNLSGKR